jgi:hypothetical protein
VLHELKTLEGGVPRRELAYAVTDSRISRSACAGAGISRSISRRRYRMLHLVGLACAPITLLWWKRAQDILPPEFHLGVPL